MYANVRESPIAESPIAASPIAESPIADFRGLKLSSEGRERPRRSNGLFAVCVNPRGLESPRIILPQTLAE